MIELKSDGNRPELLQCLKKTEARILGFNSVLDHSWVGSKPFLTIAKARNVPVTQWILDHPSSRWSEFSQSTSTNSRYLFHSEYSEQGLPQVLFGKLRDRFGGWCRTEQTLACQQIQQESVFYPTHQLSDPC